MKRINFDKKTMLAFAGTLFVILVITIGVYCFVKGKSPQEIIPTVKKENQELEVVKKQEEEFSKKFSRIRISDLRTKENATAFDQIYDMRITKFYDKMHKIEDMNIFKDYIKFLEKEIKTCEKELKAFENKKEEDGDFDKKRILEDNKRDLDDEYKLCKDKERLFTKKDKDATKQAEIDKELKNVIATIVVKNEIHNLNKQIETEKDEDFKQVLIKQKDLFTQMIK